MIAIGKTTTLLLTTLVAFGASGVEAQQVSPARVERAQVITWPEFRSVELQWFDDVDANHDGTVNVRDYRAWMHARFAHAMPLVSIAGETMTRRAFVAALRRQFEALDSNHDGVLSASELRAGAPVPRTFDFGVPDGQAF